MMTDEALYKLARQALEKELADVKRIDDGPILRGFLGGDLVCLDVEYLPDTRHPEIKQPDQPEEYYVLIRDSGTKVWEYPVDVFREVIDYKPNLWHKIISAVSVPGLIAVLVTVTICWLLVHGHADVPQVLGAALTTILGFYFGRQVSHT